VAVDVPAGVPLPAEVGDVDDEPPQPTINRTITTTGAQTIRVRRPTNSRLETPKASSIHPANRTLGGQLSNGLLTALFAAVVVTVIITVAAELPDTLTDPGTLQSGAGLGLPGRDCRLRLHRRWQLPTPAAAGHKCGLWLSFPSHRWRGCKDSCQSRRCIAPRHLARHF
jgi:hypothetical protein